MDTGILLFAVFKLELEMGYSSETSLCTLAPSPIYETPFLRFFFLSEGRGPLYTGYLKRIIHLQTVCQIDG